MRTSQFLLVVLLLVALFLNVESKAVTQRGRRLRLHYTSSGYDDAAPQQHVTSSTDDQEYMVSPPRSQYGRKRYTGKVRKPSYKRRLGGPLTTFRPTGSTTNVTPSTKAAQQPPSPPPSPPPSLNIDTAPPTPRATITKPIPENKSQGQKKRGRSNDESDHLQQPPQKKIKALDPVDELAHHMKAVLHLNSLPTDSSSDLKA